jgi:cytochrome c-type biogenesis protein CcmF
MVDQRTRDYNRAVAAGQVYDDDGFRVNQPIEFVELEKGKPKLIDGRYMVTFLSGEYHRAQPSGRAGIRNPL